MEYVPNPEFDMEAENHVRVSAFKLYMVMNMLHIEDYKQTSKKIHRIKVKSISFLFHLSL